jgi:hypothetical protein
MTIAAQISMWHVLHVFKLVVNTPYKCPNATFKHGKSRRHTIHFIFIYFFDIFFHFLCMFLTDEFLFLFAKTFDIRFPDLFLVFLAGPFFRYFSSHKPSISGFLISSSIFPGIFRFLQKSFVKTSCSSHVFYYSSFRILRPLNILFTINIEQ